MSFAVVGTDTEVGKTVACAALLLRLAPGRHLGYWKAIASGAVDGRDTDTVRALVAEAPGRIDVLPESYLFDAPLSPHVAARLEGRTLDPHRVRQDFERHREAVPGRALVVEGVGGLLVPLTDEGFLLPGLLAALDLPCVVVARSTLGTINHTLLTLEAMRARGLRVAGVLLNGPENPENRRAIERFGQIEILGQLPLLAELTPRALVTASAALDPENRLAELVAEGARRAPADAPERLH